MLHRSHTTSEFERYFYLDLPIEGENNQPAIQIYQVPEFDIDTDSVFTHEVVEVSYFLTNALRDKAVKEYGYLSLKKYAYEIAEMGIVLESDNLSDLNEYVEMIDNKTLPINSVFKYKGVEVVNIFVDENLLNDYKTNIVNYFNGIDTQCRIVMVEVFEFISKDYLHIK